MFTWNNNLFRLSLIEFDKVYDYCLMGAFLLAILTR